MNILFFRFIKIVIFLFAYYISSYIALSILKKRNSGAAISDPEIIVTGVISAAVITGVLTFTIKHLV